MGTIRQSSVTPPASHRGLPAFLRRHVWRRWREHQWPAIGALWLAALALGYAGFARHFAWLGTPRPPGDLLYLCLQLFVLESGAVAGPRGWELEVARFLAPSVAAYTAVRALAAVFYQELQTLRLRTMRRHVVICGVGRTGSRLARGFLARGERVVGIERDPSDAWLEGCREQGGIVLVGDARNPDLLRRARVQHARYLVAVCGDDGTNAEVAVHACQLVAGRQDEVLTCFIQIIDPRLCSLLRERELAMEKAGPFRLEFFNLFDSGARALLEEFPPPRRAGRPPHLLVVGAGRLGESLVVHAARSWQAGPGSRGERLRISLLDRYAESKAELLHLRHPRLDEACELVPHQMDVRSGEFQRAGFLYDPQGRCDVSAVYVCLDDDSLGLSAGLALLQRLRDERVPIVVRMTDAAGLATLLRGVEGVGGFDSLRAFALLDRTCRPETLLAGEEPPTACPPPWPHPAAPAARGS